MEDSKKTSEDEEASLNARVKFLTYVLLFCGIGAIIGFWVFTPTDIALLCTPIVTIKFGFFILALKKGWIKPGKGSSSGTA